MPPAVLKMLSRVGIASRSLLCLPRKHFPLPTLSKQALILPVTKQGIPLDSNKHHLIFLLFAISKVFETVTSNQLCLFPESGCHFWFQPNRSSPRGSKNNAPFSGSKLSPISISFKCHTFFCIYPLTQLNCISHNLVLFLTYQVVLH